MATIVTNPTLIVPKTQARVTFTPTTGNFVRVWCYDAPQGSSLRAELDDNDAPDLPLEPTPDNPPKNRVRIDLRAVPGGFEWTFIPDKGGKFLVCIQEYNRGTSFGGSYADDPAARREEVEIGPLQLASVTVVQWVETKIGAVPDQATLVLATHEDLIVGTNIETHGFRSPALVDPQTTAAESACAAPTVQSALSALAGMTAEAALGASAPVMTNLIDQFNDHLTQAGVHATDDVVHSISTSLRNPGSPAGVERAVAEVQARLVAHMGNKDVSQVSEDAYHTESGDFVPGAGPINSVAALWRAYELHRVSEVHAHEDTINALAPLPPLLNLARLFIQAATEPAPEPEDRPPVHSDGATLLVLGAGFREEPLL